MAGVSEKLKTFFKPKIPARLKSNKTLRQKNKINKPENELKNNNSQKNFYSIL